MKRFLFILLFLLLCPIFTLAADKIDINTASLAQLDTLAGIGPTYAQRIIDARPFSSVDDLLKIKGIGPLTLQKIKDQGLACVNCETTQAITNNQDTITNQTPNTNNQTPPPAPTPAPTPVITAPIIYPSGVFINEIMPNPEGADEANEWIELYNYNNFDADLSGWQIKDTMGTGTTYTILQNTKILANGYLVFKRPDTKIVLNNEEDGLDLLTPDGKNVNSVSYKNAPLNQSYNKNDTNWRWSTILTPGTINIISAVKNGNKTLPKSKNSDKNNTVEIGLADLSQITNSNQEDNESMNPWFLFFTALAMTIISASLVLFIKFKLKKNSSG